MDERVRLCVGRWVWVTHRVDELGHALVVAGLLEVNARAGGVRQHVAAHLLGWVFVCCICFV